MKLSPKELCPIHRSRFCCGRPMTPIKKSGKWIAIGQGVRKHIDTGLIRRSPAAMRQLLAKKLAEQNNICPGCKLPFTDFRQVTPDHIEPRGLGGALRNDSEENIRALCFDCNLKKGSRRIA